jgi:hypothetical protein
VGDPNDGTAASADAMARFIFSHAVWGNGGRAANFARSGSTPGGSTFAASRGDGIDWAYTINTRDWPAGTQPLNALGDAINNVLNTAAI